ncbi:MULTISPECIES: arginase family protein [unclassified Rhizobium]|uniref:arginase family protein n=1 Tax=unclassified Rhizobium TaxID=2613769 RepID=UPI001AD9BAD1|nr:MULTISPECIES: arginase family protein [unclassified Rhizobium]MBO9127753.1 arginase family protein [Rhizobium sp. 16-488-2b]MBO9178215.1 arginase family protein [Rhizobium sp. 16-488-2a]
MLDDIRKMPITLIGLPYNYGTRVPTKTNSMCNGPLVLLKQENVPAAMAKEFDDIEVIMIDDVDEPTARETGGDVRLLPAGDQMARQLVQSMRLATVLREARSRGRLALAAIGTCSQALGMVGRVAEPDEEIGMIWLDCHGDAKTPDTTENGYFEGMPVTTIAGQCWPRMRRKIPGFREISEDRIISVGLHEQYTERARPGSGYAVGERVDKPVIEKFGFESALTQALDRLATRCKKVYVHVDVDVLDPTVLLPSYHTAPGGLTAEQLANALTLISERLEILSVAWAALDPTLDPKCLDVVVPLFVHSAKVTAQSTQRNG